MSEHGWVCYNNGPGKWFWMATYEECVHELTDDIRPATHLEKYLLQQQKLFLDELGDVEVDGWASAAQKIKRVMDATEENKKAVISTLEYVRTSYRMDIIRLQELGRWTLQGEEAIQKIDAELRWLNL